MAGAMLNISIYDPDVSTSVPILIIDYKFGQPITFSADGVSVNSNKTNYDFGASAIGVSTTMGATTPTYKMGEVFYVNTYSDGTTFYIVRGSVTPPQNVLVREDYLQGIANAIRRKNGLTDTYLPSAMEGAIDAIPTGGGGSSANLITFVVNNFKCQAEVGMTFAQWEISDYYPCIRTIFGITNDEIEKPVNKTKAIIDGGGYTISFN